MKIPQVKDFQLYFKDDLWREIVKTICRRHKISFQNLLRPENGEHIVFMVDERFVVKIYEPFGRGFEREKSALAFIQKKTSLPVSEILFEGKIEGFEYLVLTQHEGVLMTRDAWLELDESEQTGVLSQLAEGLRELHSHDARTINFDWQKFIERQAATTLERQKTNGVNSKILERLPSYLEENLKLLPKDFEPVFLHGDIHFGNLLLIERNGKWQISALFDFADSLRGFHEYDFLAIGVLMIQGQSEIQREFLLSYGYKAYEINEELRRRLMLLTILYEHSNLRKYALRLRPEAVDYTLDELEKAIWNF